MILERIKDRIINLFACCPGCGGHINHKNSVGLEFFKVSDARIWKLQICGGCALFPKNINLQQVKKRLTKGGFLETEIQEICRQISVMQAQSSEEFKEENDITPTSIRNVEDNNRMLFAIELNLPITSSWEAINDALEKQIPVTEKYKQVKDEYTWIHPISGEETYGVLISEDFTLLEPTDVFASKNGTWKECGFYTVRYTSSTGTLWVRPFTV